VDQVLTETRLQKIAALVQRGVRVSIGYGISEDATVNDPDRKGKNAIKRLESLQRAYPQTFCFRRLGNTHEKILIKDSDLAVVGSFNWLSFEGRDGDKIRYESSLMVTHREKVDDLMMEFRKRFPS
jgi:phosphatidylserine/phosphatidylglycerophosphate/cardiolipin synthase-like enzyme